MKKYIYLLILSSRRTFGTSRGTIARPMFTKPDFFFDYSQKVIKIGRIDHLLDHF